MTEPVEAPQPAQPARFPRWRRIVSWIALIIGALLVPLSTISIFARNQVLDTGHYVETMAPLARNPVIQDAAATRITNALMDQVDVAQIAEDALPPRAAFLAGPLSTGVRTFVQQATAKILASDQFQKFWDDANRLTHAQVVRLLTGNTGPVEVVDGRVQMDLGPLLGQVKENLVDNGLSFLKNVDTSKINTKLTLFQAKNLETAQQGTKALKASAFVLPILALLLFAASAFLAKDRRRAILRVGIAIAVAAALLAVALSLARSIYLNAVSEVVVSKDAARVVFDTVARDIKRANRALILLGLLIALGATLAGPSRAAVWVRSLFTRGATAAGGHVTESPFNKWVAAHLAILRTAILVLALLALVAWDQPGPLAVSVVAILVVLAFAVVEIIARGAKPRAVPEATTTGPSH